MPAVGELVQTTNGKWIIPPARCPNGHGLGPGSVLVGHQACLGHVSMTVTAGGHTTWTCRTCDATVGCHRLQRLAVNAAALDDSPRRLRRVFVVLTSCLPDGIGQLC